MTIFDILSEIHRGKRSHTSDFHHLSANISNTPLPHFFLRKDHAISVSRIFCKVQRFLKKKGTKFVVGAAGKLIDFVASTKNYPKLLGKSLNSLQMVGDMSGAKFTDKCGKLKGIPDNENYFTKTNFKLAIPTQWDRDGNWIKVTIENTEDYLAYPVRLVDLLVLVEFAIANGIYDLKTTLTEIGVYDKKMHSTIGTKFKCKRKGKLKKDRDDILTFGDLIREIVIARKQPNHYFYCLASLLDEVPLENVYLRMDFVATINRMFCTLSSYISGTGMNITMSSLRKGVKLFRQASRSFIDSQQTIDNIVTTISQKMGMYRKKVKSRSSSTSKVMRYIERLERSLADIDHMRRYSGIKFSNTCTRVLDYPSSKSEYYFTRPIARKYEVKMLLPKKWDKQGNVTSYVFKKKELYLNYSIHFPSLLYLLDIMVMYNLTSFSTMIESGGLYPVTGSEGGTFPKKRK